MSFLSKKIFRNLTSLIINEYKFYVDFKGMLYFQDTKQYIYPNAIKDKKFINQLYINLIPTKNYLQNKLLKKDQASNQKSSKQNDLTSLKQQIQRNKDYPYVAQFWGQRNFVKCGVAPLIFNRIISSQTVQNLQLSQQHKNKKLLEFSFGQYSLLDMKKICIDNQGRLWHPYLKIKKSKLDKDSNVQQRKVDIQKTNIFGVFSNQLIAQMLDKITYENNSAFLTQNGVKIKINKMSSNCDQKQMIQMIR